MEASEHDVTLLKVAMRNNSLVISILADIF